MAKIQAPKQTAPTTENPSEKVTIDLAPLTQSLTEKVGEILSGEEQAKNGRIDMVVLMHEARDEHGEALTREDVRLALQTAVAEGYGLKLADVQNKPDKIADNASKDARDRYAKRNSCYTLVSELLSMAWPKDEKQDKKVRELVDSGEKRWVVLKGAAQKKQTNRADADPNKGKITKENFAAQFNLFLTKAQADMAVTLDETYELAETALAAMKAAPKE